MRKISNVQVIMLAVLSSHACLSENSTRVDGALSDGEPAPGSSVGSGGDIAEDDSDVYAGGESPGCLCKPPYECVGDICDVPASAGRTPEPCIADDDCDLGYGCLDTVCRFDGDCIRDEMCGLGRLCLQFVCVCSDGISCEGEGEVPEPDPEPDPEPAEGEGEGEVPDPDPEPAEGEVPDPEPDPDPEPAEGEGEGEGEGGPPVCQSSPELCDGLDNDCDGRTDEDSQGAGARCEREGLLGLCSEGRTLCSADGGLVCSEVYRPRAELCNGRDDDCDGELDEELAPASCGVGECSRTVPSCLNGQTQACAAGVPADELCDGLDNDCDGQTDEDLDPLSCGVGECSRTVPSCLNGRPQVCVAGQPSPELCNGRDDDCDERTDEDLAPPPADLQLGVCAGAVKVCAGAPGWQEPDYGPDYEPDEVTCDFLDNDCDGEVDDVHGCLRIPQDNYVEVYVIVDGRGRWGRICADFWDNYGRRNMDVVCRQLGYNRVECPFVGHQTIQNDGRLPIVLDDVRCQTGGEPRLLGCYLRQPVGSHNCDHNHVVIGDRGNE